MQLFKAFDSINVTLIALKFSLINNVTTKLIDIVNRTEEKFIQIEVGIILLRSLVHNVFLEQSKNNFFI